MTAECQTILKTLPPGITPPNILSYNAADVPVLELSVSGEKFSEQQLYDYATNFIRTQLATTVTVDEYPGQTFNGKVAKGTRVATVDASNKIHFKDVKIGRDFGTETEILGGITAEEQVVQNPTDDLRKGMTVSMQTPAAG